MARLPSSGTTVVSPFRDQGELKRILSDLGVGQEFDETAMEEVYGSLSRIIGEWMSEQSRLDKSIVATALLTTAKNLSEASVLLGGLETGLHSDVEIAVTSRAAEYLAMDPGVGSVGKAQELIASFNREAARIAHVLMVARADLPDRPDEGGRPALLWYDEFTALLLDIANKAGVRATLRKDRVTGVRSGWLFEAAQALESFFWREMRSQSPEACGKRLERSLRRLGGPKRQKPRAR
jgi:hypothetical protein